MQKAKIITVLILAVLVLIIAMQNTAPVQTQLVIFTIDIPVALLIFGSLVVGFVVGMLVTGRMLGKKSRK
jgi:uncharacterized integral membrane protein